MHEAPSPSQAPLELTLPNGEHFRFLSSSRSGDGLFHFRWTLDPGRRGPPPHVHDSESETFTIVSGNLRMWVGGKRIDAGPGDRVVVPPKTRHRFHNLGEVPAVVDVSLDGPLQEDILVPVAQHLRGRAKASLGDNLRMVVHQVQVKGVGTGSAIGDGLFSLVAGVLRAFGVRGFAIDEAWDRA